MEPMSLAVSIGSALSASISIGTHLKKLKDLYQDAPASYGFAIQQCAAVNGHLASLQRLMLQSSWSKHLGTDSDTSDYFVTIVINCAENLQALQSCIERIDVGALEKGMGVRQRVKVGWRDGEIKVLLGRLGTSKGDVGLLLEILQAGASSRMEMDSQRASLRTSMHQLARSNTTKYRALRVPQDETSHSAVIVVPSNYAGAADERISRVSLADIDLSSVVLTTGTEESTEFLDHTSQSKGSYRPVARAESTRSIFAGGVFGGQMKLLAQMIEQDRVGLLRKLEASEVETRQQKDVIRNLKSLLLQRESEIGLARNRTRELEVVRQKPGLELRFHEIQERAMDDLRKHQAMQLRDLQLKSGGAMDALRENHAARLKDLRLETASMKMESIGEKRLGSDQHKRFMLGLAWFLCIALASYALLFPILFVLKQLGFKVRGYYCFIIWVNGQVVLYI